MSQAQLRQPGVDGTHHGVTGGYGWSSQDRQDTVELPRVVPVPRSHRRTGGVLPAWAFAAVAVLWAGLAGLVYSGRLDAVPLLGQRRAEVVEVLAAAALIGSWPHRDRRWWRRTLPVLLLAVVAAVASIAVVLRVSNTVTDAYPWSFAVWAGLVVLALAGVPLVGRRTGVLRRAGAVAALPLTVAGALLLIDQQYGVWPQLGDLLGHEHTTSAADLAQALHPPPGTVVRPPAQGVVVALDVPATRSGFRHRAGSVYLPPAYFTAARARLPVLLMLAGSLGTPASWASAGRAVSTVDRYAQAHHGLAPVLLFVDQNGSATGDTECVDGPQGNAETFLTADVSAFVSGQLELAPDPGRWGVVGFSEGGTCALDLVLRHPEVYRHVVDLGGDDRPTFGNPAHTLSALFGGSRAALAAHDPAQLLATRRYPGCTAWFTAGADDPRNLAIAQRFAVEAARAGMTEHEFTGVSGHNWQFASQALARIMPDLAPELGLPGTITGT